MQEFQYSPIICEKTCSWEDIIVNLLIDHNQLELLLEKNKDRIGHNSIEGIDTLFSGITFLISTIFASYNKIGVLSEWNIKVICFVLGFVFSLRGIYMIVKSRKRKYGHTMLLEDIENINKITHPFSIIVIKDSFQQYPNRFLLYYDNRWKCRLFINYRTSTGTGADNEQNICSRLSNELKIPANQIAVKYVTERIQRKFSVSDQVFKCYEHKVYYVTIPFTDKLKRRQFNIDGKQYCWMTISDMEKDSDIQSKNLDVVNLVRETIV